MVGVVSASGHEEAIVITVFVCGWTFIRTGKFTCAHGGSSTCEVDGFRNTVYGVTEPIRHTSALNKSMFSWYSAGDQLNHLCGARGSRVA